MFRNKKPKNDSIKEYQPGVPTLDDSNNSDVSDHDSDAYDSDHHDQDDPQPSTILQLMSSFSTKIKEESKPEEESKKVKMRKLDQGVIESSENQFKTKRPK